METDNNEFEIGFKLLKLLSEDHETIPYRKKLNALTNRCIPATILLQQIIYWWFKNGRKKFYKFRGTTPETAISKQKDKAVDIKHPLYKRGDSWCEELDITRKEFDRAIKKIGFKLGKTKNLIKKEDAYVIYYTDKDGLTWYSLNEALLSKDLFGLYKDEALKDFAITTEITTKTTNKKEDILSSDDDTSFSSYQTPTDNIISTNKQDLTSTSSYLRQDIPIPTNTNQANNIKVNHLANDPNPPPNEAATPPKVAKAEIDEIVNRYLSVAEEDLGFRPKLSPKDFAAIKRALKEWGHDMTLNMLDFFFTLPKFKEFTGLSAAFSADTYNKYCMTWIKIRGSWYDYSELKLPPIKLLKEKWWE